MQEASDRTQGAAGAATKPIVRETPKVGRNDLCPCGSGKKYKKCHGANAA
ncbi:MAG: SEC-C metal-binding domain-containing protein [Tepidisphaeraceae bacterium]